MSLATTVPPDAASLDAPSSAGDVATASSDAPTTGNDAANVDLDAGAAIDAPSWTFVRLACGGYDSGAACEATAVATLSSPQVTGPEGGPPAPGMDGTISVVLSAPSEGISYPCVGFAADNPGVSFSPGTDPEFIGIYALGQGQSATVPIATHFASSIAHGTLLHFAAWVDSLNSACSDGAQLEWDVTMP
jgi:hypothetical protein